MIFKHNQDPISSFCGLKICVKALLGDPISMSTPEGTNHQLNVVSMCAIRNVIREKNAFWNALKFEVQVPDINVLIPPYMNDEKVLRYNPELLQH